MVDMRLLINKKDLALLLERKRDYIGNRVAADTVIAGVSFYYRRLQQAIKIYSLFQVSYLSIHFALLVCYIY